MVDKVLNEITALDSFTDPGGVTHTGAISSSGGDNSGVIWNHNGSVTAQSDLILYLTEVSDGGSLSPSTVTVVGADGLALPTNTTLDLGVIDSGGEFTSQVTLAVGDGSTRYIEITTDDAYDNSSGSSTVGAVMFRNQRDSSVGVFTQGTL